jgi:hypothetical protein
MLKDEFASFSLLFCLCCLRFIEEPDTVHMFILPFADMAYQKMADLKEQCVSIKLFKWGEGLQKISKCWK